MPGETTRSAGAKLNRERVRDWSNGYNWLGAEEV